MKKLISLLMVTAMILSLLVLTGCAKAEPLKLGLGVTTTLSAADATADKNGQGKATSTIAAVLVDSEGKVIKAAIDSTDNTLGFTADGKAVANDSFLTKYEKGKDYNMVAYGGATKEWYEQADAFCSVIIGKTATEIKALLAADNKGTADVINAGCTIDVADFVTAVDKAIANAAASDATANDEIKLGVHTAQTLTDATADKPGSNKIETYIFAAAVNAEGKVTAAESDCVEVSFGFDATGKSTTDTAAATLTKREKGDNYGMKAYGGAAKEWFEQADAFDAACLGKTAGEIVGLVGSDGMGNADLQAAGCTIYADGFTKAAGKIG